MAITTKEKILKVNTENVPTEMAHLEQWVMWRAELNEKNEYDKIPYQLIGLKASSVNPSSWSNFEKSVEKLNEYDGVGFVLTKADDYIVLDLDDIHIDNETYEPLTDIAKEVMEKTWWEVSPSGTGIHAYFKGTLPDKVMKKNKSEHLELYSHSRFMTFTGVNDGVYREVSNDQSYIDSLVERYFKREVINDEFIPNQVTPSNLDDVEVMKLMEKSKNADKLSKLMSGGWREIFESQSEADLSLLNALAFYTQKNIVQMDRIFRDSDLMRPKWDELRGAKTYGQISIEKAIADCKNVYDPKFNNSYEIQLNEESTEVIPSNYKIGDNKWLYKLVEKGRGDDKQIVPMLITSTPPFITKCFKDIESLIISYEMSYLKANEVTKFPVQALDIRDAKNIINLSSKGLDVDSNNRSELVQFISMFMRLNNLSTNKTVSRLGHVRGHFIHPLIDSDVELFIHEEGYKRLANAFKTKGTLQDYSDTVFKQVKDSPMAMMFVYASLGSILLYDFNVEPFIIDLSGKTSTGKTTALKVASSVWGTDDLRSEWNTTKVSVERKASMMNSFPLIYDDTRKAPVYQLADIVYQFSGGRSKGRGNIHSIDSESTWQNILISTGETSIVEYGQEKAGISARVITLQDNPFSDDVDLRALYDGLENNFGHLGLAFIDQYNKHKLEYKESFKGHEKLFIEKAGDNEVMQRLGRPFALLQTSAEILNDIEGFEHNLYSTVQCAYESMKESNKSIDKPKQLLVEVLEYMQANRNNIIGEGYPELYSGEIKGIYKNSMLGVQSETLKNLLGHELTTIVKEWDSRKYLINDGKRLQKQVKHKGQRSMVYAINEEIIKELGFDFSQTHYHYSDE
ncbi:phage NrS-1 polymerase family protein [Mammaliicoccus sciuri]|uniref:phage NrS-1 polymerase family protein n=1 Tax=Mammaliicoccus sciuri TaxID=1296 RepID=UPI003AD9A5C9